MKWKPTSPTKIYEAIGAVADNRVEVTKNTGKVYSSSKNKYYDISYNRENNEIMSNDNTSYWTEELGYPAIAFLIKRGDLSYEESVGSFLKNVPWKDINQKFKNSFNEALEYILSSKTEAETIKLKELVDKIYTHVCDFNLGYSRSKMFPPKGY